MATFDRVIITGNSDRGHLNLEPIAEPAGANSGGIYLGTDGQLHVHDGAAWSALSAVNSFPLVDNRIYDSTTAISSVTTSTGAMTANRLYAVPVLVKERRYLNNVSVWVQGGSAGNVRVGVYAATADYLPGSLLVDIGTADTGTGFILREVADTAYTELLPGIYFLAAVFSGTPTVTTITAVSSELGIASGSPLSYYYVAHTYGALPASFGTPTSASGAGPRLMFSTLAAQP